MTISMSTRRTSSRVGKSRRSFAERCPKLSHTLPLLPTPPPSAAYPSAAAKGLRPEGVHLPEGRDRRQVLHHRRGQRKRADPVEHAVPQRHPSGALRLPEPAAGDRGPPLGAHSGGGAWAAAHIHSWQGRTWRRIGPWQRDRVRMPKAHIPHPTPLAPTPPLPAPLQPRPGPRPGQILCARCPPPSAPRA